MSNGARPDERLCARCTNKLSRYNSTDTCYPCQDKARDLGLSPAPKAPVRDRSAELERIDAAVAICKTLTPVFSTYQLADAMRINIHAASGLLRGLRLRCLVEQHGDLVLSGPRIDNRRKPVAMWRVL